MEEGFIKLNYTKIKKDLKREEQLLKELESNKNYLNILEELNIKVEK